MKLSKTVPALVLVAGLAAIAAIATVEHRAQATAGSAGVILSLLGAFGFSYRRSARARATVQLLTRERERLLAVSREEALTDALTGLGNRRALIDDLEAALDRRKAISSTFSRSSTSTASSSTTTRSATRRGTSSSPVSPSVSPRR